jgi:hypothetical protein
MTHRLPPSMSVPFIRVILGIFSLSLAGCGWFGLSDKFDQAIREVHDLRIALENQSDNWRTTLKNAQLKLTSDVKEILNVDLRDAIDKSIAEMGIEAKCDLDFINENLKVWLIGIEDAIKKKKEEFYRSPIKATLSPEKMIDDAIHTAPPLVPRICHVIPTEVTFVLPDKTPDRSAAEFVGYALTQVESEPMALVLFGPDRPANGYPIPNSNDLVILSTSYKAAVNCTRIAPHLNPSDVKCRLMRASKTLAEIGISVKDPPAPPPPPKITAVQVNFHTTGDDKDTEIEFHLAINRPGAPGGPVVDLGAIGVGNNEKWDNGDRRTITIPLNPPWPYPNRAILNLYIGYDSHGRGNPGWEGSLNVVAVCDNGDLKEVIAETGDFKLGESGNPHSRGFPFNR